MIVFLRIFVASMGGKVRFGLLTIGEKSDNQMRKEFEMLRHRIDIEKIVYKHLESMMNEIDEQVDHRNFYTPDKFTDYLTRIIVSILSIMVDYSSYLSREDITIEDLLG